MKTISILLLVMIVSAVSFAQDKKPNLDEITVTPPKFTGINDAVKIYGQENFTSFESYLRKNLKYPETLLKNGVNGTEVVHFEVSADGKLTDFKVINSVSPEIDQAVYDLLKTTCGMWKPGENNGEPVSMKKEISVAFKWNEFDALRNTKDFEALARYYYKKGSKHLFDKSNPKRALKCFNQGIKYKPNEDCLLLSRGMCKYELGDYEGAYEDWNKMRIAGIEQEAKNIANNFTKMKGYSTLASIIEK